MRASKALAAFGLGTLLGVGVAAAQTWTISAGKLVLRSSSAVQVATFEQR